MKTFKQYICEVINWSGNTLFAVGPGGYVEYHHDKENITEHPDAFTHLNFNNRPSSREYLMGIEDLRDSNAERSPYAKRPKARSWGRVDHTSKVIHIITEHGMSPYGTGIREKDKRKKESDVFTRLHALKTLKKDYPEYQIHHGYVSGESILPQWNSPRTPRVISFSQYEKELTDMLKD